MTGNTRESLHRLERSFDKASQDLLRDLTINLGLIMTAGFVIGGLLLKAFL